MRHLKRWQIVVGLAAMLAVVWAGTVYAQGGSTVYIPLVSLGSENSSPPPINIPEDATAQEIHELGLAQLKNGFEGSEEQQQRALNLAVEYFNAALEKDPEYFDSYAARATAYSSLGETGKAVESYERALSIKPSATVQRNLGVVQERLGNYKAALKHYEMAVSTYGFSTEEFVEIISGEGGIEAASAEVNGVTLLNVSEVADSLEKVAELRRQLNEPMDGELTAPESSDEDERVEDEGEVKASAEVVTVATGKYHNYRNANGETVSNNPGFVCSFGQDAHNYYVYPAPYGMNHRYIQQYVGMLLEPNDG